MPATVVRCPPWSLQSLPLQRLPLATSAAAAAVAAAATVTTSFLFSRRFHFLRYRAASSSPAPALRMIGAGRKKGARCVLKPETHGRGREGQRFVVTQIDTVGKKSGTALARFFFGRGVGPVSRGVVVGCGLHRLCSIQSYE